jgi:hypothetical protein
MELCGVEDVPIDVRMAWRCPHGCRRQQREADPERSQDDGQSASQAEQATARWCRRHVSVTPT